MTNDKPTVVVTEADRRAAWEHVSSRDSVPGECPPGVIAWIASGDPSTFPVQVSVFPAIAQAIAHARTMAAFEERVSCAFKLAQVCDEIQLSVVVGIAVDADQGPDMLTDDDIRALVLKGWGQ